MAGVEVDRQYRMATQLGKARRATFTCFPRCIQIPAVAAGVVADVVADRPRGCLSSHLASAVREHDWARQPVPAMCLIREVGERGGQLDFYPPLIGMPADGLVSPPLVSFPVGTNEPPLRLPALPPRTLFQAGIEVAARAGQSPSTPHDRQAPLLQAGVRNRQPGLQTLQALLLLPAFTLCRIPAGAAVSAGDRRTQPATDLLDPRPQRHPLGEQVTFRQPPRVIGCTGDRSRPAR